MNPVSGIIIMLRFILLISLLFVSVGYASESEYSQKLEKLRIKAIKNPTEQNEKAYLDEFPTDFNKFYYTFYGHKYGERGSLGELYDKHIEHLFYLNELANKYPEKVLAIWLDVAQEGHWYADAVGILQHHLANYAANNTNIFTKKLKQRSIKSQTGIVRFLADVENHRAYSDYQTIINNLHSLGELELENRFIKARKEREKIQNH